MNPRTEAAVPAGARKPRFSLFIATACGLGYLPKAPGTFGALAGVALFWAAHPHIGGHSFDLYFHTTSYVFDIGWVLTLFLAALGVWASGRVANYAAKKDPQFVVIDEVSGQHFTFLLGLASANWKYLLLGFILFRAFDIWKPFPARQAESLPGGWGIMADDWVAAVYAALGLWIARAAGL